MTKSQSPHFAYVADLLDDVANAPGELMGALAQMRAAAATRDLAAMRAALREANAIGFNIAAALLSVEAVSAEIAPELRVA